MLFLSSMIYTASVYTYPCVYCHCFLIQFWQLHTEVQWSSHALIFTLCTLASCCCCQSKHYKLMTVHSLHHMRDLAKLFTIFTLCSRLFFKHLDMISFWLKHAVCKRIIKGCVWQKYVDLQESALPWYKIHLSDYWFCIFHHKFYIAYVAILCLHFTGKSRFYAQLNIPHLSEVIPKIVIKFLVFLGHHR